MELQCLVFLEQRYVLEIEKEYLINKNQAEIVARIELEYYFVIVHGKKQFWKNCTHKGVSEKKIILFLLTVHFSILNIGSSSLHKNKTGDVEYEK